MVLLNNHALIAAVIGWFAAEIIKMIINVCRTHSFREIKLSDLFASGGMPSSHSAAMCGLTAACAWIYGLGSPMLAVSAVISMIVMYDASGVRRETGEQSKALNIIVRDMFSGKPEFADKAFKEFIGHTKLQVVVGAILGFAIGFGYPFLRGVSPNFGL